MLATIALIFVLCKLSTSNCEMPRGPKGVRLYDDIQYSDPLTLISDNYNNDPLIEKLHRNFLNEQLEIQNRQQEANKNFIRFGRGHDKNLMRFGKRQIEYLKDLNSQYNNNLNFRSERRDLGVERDSRGDNFMRFGRPSNGMLRFGRQNANFQSNDNEKVYHRSIKSNNKNLMRFGRRSFDNAQRFDRSDNYMRFGRDPTDQPNILNEKLDRFARNQNGFLRLGKSNQNLMRFGKRNNDDFQFSHENEDLDFTTEVSLPNNFSVNYNENDGSTNKSKFDMV